MRIWLMTIGEPLPSDPGNERLLRTGLLSDVLRARGHEVVWWASSFNHAAKRQRCETNTSIRVRDRLELRLIQTTGYSRNVSLARIRSHRRVAQGFLGWASSVARPDAILCSLPILELCDAATGWGADHGVPVVLDVRDLWPDVIAEVAPRQLRQIADAVLTPMKRMARRACARASALTGVTEQFVAWGLRQAGRGRGEWDRAFPMGYSDSVPAEAALIEAAEFWRTHRVERDPSLFRLCFFGTIGRQFELDTVIDAARLLSGRHRFQVVICGSGDRLSQYRAQAADVPEVLFPGRIDAAAIWTLLRMSNAGLAPYRDSPNFRNNLPNKPVEYLSAGLPIVATGPGVLASLLLRHDCGLVYDHGQAQQLAAAIETLVTLPQRHAEKSLSAARLYQREYRAETTYGAMAEHLERLAGSHPVEATA